MDSPNDLLPIFPSFDAPGGRGVLLDHAQSIRVKDHADQEVRDAMRSVAAKEHRIASELGLEGITAVESWDHRIAQVGPHAAIEAAQLYQAEPRLAPVQEEDKDPDDYSRSARAAFKQVVEKERREANLPVTVSKLDQLERRHNGLDVIETFKRFDSQLRQNPADAAPRVATEIHNRIAEAQGQHWAVQQVNDYERRYRISDDERPIMRRLLETNQVHDLPTAHARAKFELALDIKDPHQRAVLAARRAQAGPEGRRQ